jgi:hypothetical protein
MSLVRYPLIYRFGPENDGTNSREFTKAILSDKEFRSTIYDPHFHRCKLFVIVRLDYGTSNERLMARA